MTIAVAVPLRAHLRYAAGVAWHWANPSNMPGRHSLRVERIRATWPELATLLDGLVESLPDADMADASGPTCPSCASPVSRIRKAPDPRTVEQVCKVEPCGHVIDEDEGHEMHWAGVPFDVIPLDGATLIGAAVRAAREAGHSVEADLEQHDDGDLGWAAWCLISEAASRDAPPMWPFGASRWEPQTDRVAGLVQAGMWVASEVDRELAKREKAS